MDGIFSGQKLTISISSWTVIKVLLILLGAYFLFLIRDVLAVVFVSLIFASAIHPIVDFFSRFKIPRGVTVLSIYLVMFSFITLVVILLVPAIVDQLKEISKNIPNIYASIVNFYSTVNLPFEESVVSNEIQKSIGAIQTALSDATRNVFDFLIRIFGGIISFFSVLVITFYITVEEQAIKRVVLFLVPGKHQAYTLQTINRMQYKIGLWLRGQLILMLIIGVLTYIALLIARVEYALVLALLAGLAEFIPFLGPLIAAIPAVLFAFVQSPLLMVAVIIIYVVIQQVENDLIVPKLMEKAVGLNPLVIIIALLIGAKLAGVVGAILSIPVTTAISVVVRDHFGLKDSGTSL